MEPSSIKFIPSTLLPTPKPLSSPPSSSPTLKPSSSPTLQPGSIEGLVYFDAQTNGDGFDQITDFGVYNVPLWLFSCNSTHLYNLLNKTTTSTRGEYSFDDLIPGQYYVYIDPPSYYRLSEKWNGDTSLNGDLISPEADSSFNPETGDTVCLNLSGGEIIEQNAALWSQITTPAPNPPKTQPYFTVAPSKSPIATNPTPIPTPNPTTSLSPTLAPNPPKTQPYFTLVPSKSPIATKPTPPTNTNIPTPRPSRVFAESESPTLPQPTTNSPTKIPDTNLFSPTTSKPSPSPSTTEPTIHPAWNFFLPTTNNPTAALENKLSFKPSLPPGGTVSDSLTIMPSNQPTGNSNPGRIIPNSVNRDDVNSSIILKLRCVPVLASLTAFVWSFKSC